MPLHKSLHALLPVACVVLIFGTHCEASVAVAVAQSATATAPPVISSIAPTSVTAGAPATVLTISGSGFDSASKVFWNKTALTTTFVSKTQLRTSVPAEYLAGSAQISIEVNNPSSMGGASEGVIYLVDSPTPSITSLSPSAVASGKAVTITIIGSGFETKSVAQWNGYPRPTTFISPTALKVALAAADLGGQGLGQIAVNNPDPGGSTSEPASLQFTSSPLSPPPVIQSASIAAVPGVINQCQQLEVTLTGENFSELGGETIHANGVALQTVYLSPTSVAGYLPLGFVSQPGALSLTVSETVPAANFSQPFAYPANAPPIMALCQSTSFYTPTVYAGSGFLVSVVPSEVNIAGSGTVTLGTLPPGFTAPAMSATLPPSGTAVRVNAGTGVKPGSYSFALNGTAEGATAAGDFSFTLASGTPNGFYLSPLSLPSEVQIPIGGSTQVDLVAGVDFSGGGSLTPDYSITPSASGLPAGVTASFAPSAFFPESAFGPGQIIILTLSASANAPVAQNATITITGSPAVKVSPATLKLTAFVSQPPNKMPGSRTDFVSTAGTPYAAAFDQAHDLIFASNPDWNRVDVISNRSHKIIKSIPVRSPRGIDVTPNGQNVWVQTAAQSIFEINTTTLQAKSYLIPTSTVNSSGLPVLFAFDRILALSDGTVLLYFNDGGGEGEGYAGVWDPKTGRINVLSPQGVSAWGVPVRSGDGTQVYAANGLYDNGIEHYDVLTGKLTKIGTASFWSVMSVNRDGTLLITGPGIYTQPGIYDQNLKRLASLPGSTFDNGGGAIFSADDSKVYVVAPENSNNQANVLFTVDAETYKLLGTAPSIGATGIFASDATGLVFGVDTYGISFDDAAYTQKFGANGPTGSGSAFGVFGGPLPGGGAFSLYAPPPLAPGVWFGSVRGTTSYLDGALTFLAPPSATAGPVNVKLNFPDGSMWLFPQEFGYGTDPEYAVTSGSGPAGGAPAEIIGYGIPQDAGSGAVSVGGVEATITTTQGQYPPYSGEPYPSTKLDYTLPPGAPGWADIEVSTPIGFGRLPNSVFYAKSVNEYASKDKFNALLFDQRRNVVYASAGNHIDVFSVAENKFLSPLHPAGTGPSRSFGGLALTPDGSTLLAAESAYGGLSVIDPDAPSNTFAVAIPGGANYVAAMSDGRAFVSAGIPYSPSSINIVDLTTRAVTMPSSCASGSWLDSTSDGNYVAIGDTNCIYSVKNNSFTTGHFPTNTEITAGFGGDLAGDGNVFATFLAFGDINGNPIGDVALPLPLYPFLPSTGSLSPSPIFLPRLNASGSLYYFAYPNWLEIVDVAHGLLRMRFALTQTVENSMASMAIDSGGRYVFLITEKGLTEVDLGFAPLSIGHLSVQSAAPGTVVTVRGGGYEAGMTATVGGVDATVRVTDQNTLSLTVPDAKPGPQDIILTKPDGEIYTLENGITVL
jgi:hypothetical protein